MIAMVMHELDAREGLDHNTSPSRLKTIRCYRSDSHYANAHVQCCSLTAHNKSASCRSFFMLTKILKRQTGIT